jgi:hypothetical protein
LSKQDKNKHLARQQSFHHFIQLEATEPASKAGI